MKKTQSQNLESTGLLRRRSLLLAAGASATLPALSWAAGNAGAAIPPLVKLIVGYSAGGPVDGAARLLAPALGEALGTQVIVENRPGASGSLGGEAVTRAAPDGATIYFGASPTITINPNIQRAMTFDPARDLTPLAPLLAYTNVLVVNNDLPVRNVKELIAYARAHPGKVFYGSAGVGASNHMCGALLEKMTGAPFAHVPYKGNAPAMADVMGGTLAMMFDIVATARTYIVAGKVRALAVTSRERNRMLPEVPTMIESGVPDYDVGGWYGLYGPAKMNPALVTAINAATGRMLAREDVTKRLSDLGYDAWSGDPAALARKGQADRQLWAMAAKGIQTE
ncbi:tripartite tricarboxylate transporter substrate binding protein [Variovorax sp.]|uniref:Bug family tripartite tricarboxylate transporter substrate binding protein n=1 Tax=Variovorax sp. TaxID=1871043 RepID=UPI002D23E770|nr:tripartite tricarboxylate transporter substrate binding protein [Variovorax sp.]HYP84071.1 tripartite tricarboxylate transporter substrate binding protein [Variovorax sp.]